MSTMILEHSVKEKLHEQFNKIFYHQLPVRYAVLAENEHYLIKLAENQAEISAAQELRYRVFKEEQGRLSTCSDVTDRDYFDSFCRHLVVVEKGSGRIVGTYRVLTNNAAHFAGRFYSQDEFTISGLKNMRDDLCEVGRSCVDPEFRNGAVVSLLWSGLISLRHHSMSPFGLLEKVRRHYHRRPAAKFEYLFGCVSLEETDPVAALALYEYCLQNNLVTNKLTARPRAGFELAPVSDAEVQRYLQENEKTMLRKLPPLFKGYINLGAKICGAPAYDREFGTIDFLILQDMREIPERYLRHLVG